MNDVERFRAEVLRIVRDQPYFPDTHTGKRQQWVKDQITQKIEALPHFIDVMEP